MTIDRLRDLLGAIGPPVTPVELAEMIWLAGHLPIDGQAYRPVASTGTEATVAGVEPDTTETGTDAPQKSLVLADQPGQRQPLYPPSAHLDDAAGSDARALLVPTAPMLRHPLVLQRALRPLKRRIPTQLDRVLDEDATAARIAQHIHERPWIPVMAAGRERWLSLAIVIDSGPAASIWQPLGSEFREAMFRLGAFRDVRIWFAADVASTIRIRASPRGPALAPSALVDPTGRQAIVLLSDCSGPHWWDGRMGPAVHSFARYGPTAILQPLAERMWRRTAAPAVPGQAVLARPGAPNTELRFTPHNGPSGERPGKIPVPVLEPSPAWMADWARLIAATGGATDTAVTYLSALVHPFPEPLIAERELPVRERVLRFRAAASPDAAALAGHIAVAVPALPVMQLIQQRILPRSRTSDLAEVLLSGLLVPSDAVPGLYDFVPGARAALLETLPRPQSQATADTLEQISAEIQERAGTAVRTFQAIMPVTDGTGNLTADVGQRPFALVSAEALRILSHTAIPTFDAASLKSPDHASDARRLHQEIANNADSDAPNVAEVASSRQAPAGLQPAAPPAQRPAAPVNRFPAGPADKNTTKPAKDSGADPYPPPESATPRTRLVMFGTPSSGKTSFLASLQIALLRRPELGWSLTAENPGSHQALISFLDQMIQEHQFPYLTRTQIETYRWTLETELPRAVREWHWWGFRRRSQLVKIPLDLIDPPGMTADGDLLSGRRISKNLAANLARSAGIVLFFDPISEFERGDAFRHAYQVLTQLKAQTSHRYKLPHYVAVCITKFDAIPVLKSAQRLRLVEYDTEEPNFPRVPDDHAEAFFGQLIRLSRSDNGSLILPLLEQSFHRERIRFFVTSAIGFYFDPDTRTFDPDDYQNRIPGRPDRIRGTVHPINVLEPVLWLCRNIAATAGRQTTGD